MGEAPWTRLVGPSRLQRREIRATKISPRIGAADITRLGRLDIDELYTELRETGGHDGGPLGERSIGLVHSTLSSAFNAAVGWGWLDRSPMVGVPKANSDEINPPTIDQIRAAEALIDEASWAAL